MAITITKSGPFYETAGTPISFSSLRTNFRATNKVMGNMEKTEE